MGRLSAPLLALALAAIAATGLSACGGGGSDLLPGTTASEINSNLDEVRQLVSEGDCVGAGDAAAAVSTQVEELGGVDAKLKEALSEGATRLNEVVAGCEEVPTEIEEEEAALEEAERAEEEAEASEKPEKKEKETGKPEKEPTTPAEAPEPPGQEKKEEKGTEEEAPPVEPEGEGQSGGVGPGAEVGVE
jgi:septal ring-binding cell division protein DamX